MTLRPEWRNDQVSYPWKNHPAEPKRETTALYVGIKVSGSAIIIQLLLRRGNMTDSVLYSACVGQITSRHNKLNAAVAKKGKGLDGFV